MIYRGSYWTLIDVMPSTKPLWYRGVLPTAGDMRLLADRGTASFLVLDEKNIDTFAMRVSSEYGDCNFRVGFYPGVGSGILLEPSGARWSHRFRVDGPPSGFHHPLIRGLGDWS